MLKIRRKRYGEMITVSTLFVTHTCITLLLLLISFHSRSTCSSYAAVINQQYDVKTKDKKEIQGKLLATNIVKIARQTNLHRLDNTAGNHHGRRDTSSTSNDYSSIGIVHGSKQEQQKQDNLRVEATIFDENDTTGHRDLQQEQQPERCNYCAFDLFSGICNPGLEYDTAKYGNYQYLLGNGTCYENTCCSSYENGNDCCIDTTTNPSGGGDSSTSSCSMCYTSIWDVYYCPNGKIVSMFDTYRPASIDETAVVQSQCYEDTCCSTSIENCCNNDDTIDGGSDNDNDNSNTKCDYCPPTATVFTINDIECPYGKNIPLYGNYPYNIGDTTCNDITCCTPNRIDCCIPAPLVSSPVATPTTTSSISSSTTNSGTNPTTISSGTTIYRINNIPLHTVTIIVVSFICYVSL